MAEHSGYFQVACCGRRRGMLPGKVLVCSKCDFNHDGGTVIPNERHVKDVPPGTWYVYPERPGNA